VVVPSADCHHGGVGWYKYLEFGGKVGKGILYGGDVYLVYYFDFAYCRRVFAWEYEYTGTEWTSAYDWEIAEEVCHFRCC